MALSKAVQYSSAGKGLMRGRGRGKQMVDQFTVTITPLEAWSRVGERNKLSSAVGKS